MLTPQHQLDQLLFAQVLQITAVHRTMDSEIAPPGKGVGNYEYLDFYNRKRPHSSLDRKTPDEAYFNPLPLAAAA